MIYLKKFEEHSDYESYIEGTPFLPNVSLCLDKNEVHYNPLIVQPNDEIWYTSTDGKVVVTSFISFVSNTYSDGKGIIKLEKELTSINSSVSFRYSSRLASITLPNTVISIEGEAFYMCGGLTSITIPNSVTSIVMERYGGYGHMFYGCDNLAIIKVEKGNTVYDSRDNCNAIVETATNKLTCGCKNTLIPNSVTSVGSYAFCYCSGLTSIEIPNSVTTIGRQAFAGCNNLTSVIIGNSVAEMIEPFGGCTGLSTITYKGTMAQWNSIRIDVHTFYDVPATVVHCTDGDVEI